MWKAILPSSFKFQCVAWKRGDNQNSISGRDPYSAGISFNTIHKKNFLLFLFNPLNKRRKSGFIPSYSWMPSNLRRYFCEKKKKLVFLTLFLHSSCIMETLLLVEMHNWLQNFRLFRAMRRSNNNGVSINVSLLLGIYSVIGMIYASCFVTSIFL